MLLMFHICNAHISPIGLIGHYDNNKIYFTLSMGDVNSFLILNDWENYAFTKIDWKVRSLLQDFTNFLLNILIEKEIIRVMA